MIRLAICTALLAIVAGGARAQSATEALRSDCFDDNMTDRCDASVQRRVRERFDLRAIEQLSDANIQVRRVFFVDGHGGELPVVSFERAPGERPQVHVSALVENRGAHRVATLTAPVSLATWNEIIEQSRYIHRRLAEEPAPAEEPVPSGFVRVPGMCLHSWANCEAWRAYRPRHWNSPFSPPPERVKSSERAGMKSTWRPGRGHYRPPG